MIKSILKKLIKTEELYRGLVFFYVYLLISINTYSIDNLLLEKILEVNKKSNSYLMTQIIKDSSSKIELEFKVTSYIKNKKYRIEQEEIKEPKKEKNIVVYDGKNYYKEYAGLIKKINPDEISSNSMKNEVANINLEDLLNDEDSMFKEEENYYVIKNSKYNEMTLYINKNNCLIYQMDYIDSNKENISIVIKKYNLIKNYFYYPDKSMIYKNDKLIISSKTTEVNVDLIIEDKLFEVKEKDLNVKDILKNLLN